jgi:hypothetical protein
MQTSREVISGEIRGIAKVASSLEQKERSFDAEKYSPWHSFVVTFRTSFYEDKCGSVFSDTKLIWITCCMFRQIKKDGSTESFNFCGGNSVMGVPIPCRAPVHGFDYNGEIPSTNAENPAPPNEYNVGVYKCSSNDVDLETFTEPRTDSNNSSVPNYERKSVYTPVYSIDLTVPTASGISCQSPNCYSYCCSSAYAYQLSCTAACY